LNAWLMGRDLLRPHSTKTMPYVMPKRQGYLRLGQAPITPQAAEAQVVSPSQYSGAKMTQAEVTAIIQTATTGQLPFGPADFASGWNCNGQPSVGSAQLAKTAAGISLTVGTSIAAGLGVSGAILGPIGAAVGGLIGLFTAIFQHHAQAVAKEENVLCQAVPALNNTLQAIDAAVANGTLTPQGAIATMQSVQSEFANAVAGIIKDDESHCNAACVWTKCLAALAIVRTSQWQAMQETQQTGSAGAQPVTPAAAANSVISSGNTSLPSWALPVAAVALLGFLFLR
jgi:hypothetical protein